MISRNLITCIRHSETKLECIFECLPVVSEREVFICAAMTQLQNYWSYMVLIDSSNRVTWTGLPAHPDGWKGSYDGRRTISFGSGEDGMAWVKQGTRNVNSKFNVSNVPH